MLKNKLVKIGKILLKTGITLILICWILSKIDIQKMFIDFKNANWVLLIILAPTIFIICNSIYVWRWSLLLNQSKSILQYSRLMTIYLKSNVLSSILPGGITTGDAYRVYATAKDTEETALSISAVLIERLLGFLSILLVALLALYCSLLNVQNENLFRIAKFSTSITVLIILSLLVGVYVIKKYCLGQNSSNNKILSTIGGLSKALAVNLPGKRTIVKIFLLSLVLQIFIIIWNYAVSLALDIGIPFHILAMTVPVISLLALLPISIGGLGVRETGYVVFLLPFGLNPSEAVSISLLTVLLQNFLRILVGSTLFVLGK